LESLQPSIKGSSLAYEKKPRRKKDFSQQGSLYEEQSFKKLDPVVKKTVIFSRIRYQTPFLGVSGDDAIGKKVVSGLAQLIDSGRGATQFKNNLLGKKGGERKVL